ncbi:UMP kinase [Candidatus Roizmanbacteria bacterium]|nr:UMP kinase [Candidatus Roizmanbacteria bacterium]
MIHYKEPPIILSVGGSLISPSGGIDTVFLKRLNTFIRGQVKKGKRFFLVSGGGRTARQYRDAGKSVIGSLSNEDLDWLGIHATHLNGHLLRTIFQDIAHPRIIENYDKKLHKWKEPVVIGAGWKPGWSTDYDAVILARDYGANVIVNMSNIDWVYDSDPSQNPNAKPIKRMTWNEMESLVGVTWSPGINTPFDPVAAQLAKKLGLTVIVTNGTDFKNLTKIVEGDSFKGTIIMPYRIDASFYDREYYTHKHAKRGYRLGYADPFFTKLLRTVVTYYRAILIKFFINPKNCLDIGCGTGELVRILRSFGIDAYGVEISKDAIAMAEDQMKPYLKLGDVVKIPYEDAQFELVFSFDVLEHLERSKIKKAVDETIRVSKKYILHKMYTQENTYISYFHKRDFSHISVFPKKYWHRLFVDQEEVSIVRGSFFRLPSFIETIFLLKKR